MLCTGNVRVFDVVSRYVTDIEKHVGPLFNKV